MCDCKDAEACKKTGKWLCSCKATEEHPGTCCAKSCRLAAIHGVKCLCICTSDLPYELAKMKHWMDPKWKGADPCYGDNSHCCGFLYHTIVCSLCLPFMVLTWISGALCCCVGCWNDCCRCDDHCKSKVEPVQTQPSCSNESVWTTDQSGQWD